MTPEQVAKQLLSDLKSGKLAKIGIDEIRAAIRGSRPGIGEFAVSELEERVTRLVVEGASR